MIIKKFKTAVILIMLFNSLTVYAENPAGVTPAAKLPQSPVFERPSVSNQASILAIDTSYDHAINPNSIFSGMDSILMVAPQGISGVRIRLNDLKYISNDEELHTLDVERNGRIDPNDSMFNRLYLLTVNSSTSHYTIMNVFSAGVRAIILNKNYSNLKSTNQAFGFTNHYDEVIMSDGTSRIIQYIIVDKNKLNNIMNYSIE